MIMHFSFTPFFSPLLLITQPFQLAKNSLFRACFAMVSLGCLCISTQAATASLGATSLENSAAYYVHIAESGVPSGDKKAKKGVKTAPTNKAISVSTKSTSRLTPNSHNGKHAATHAAGYDGSVWKMGGACTTGNWKNAKRD